MGREQRWLPVLGKLVGIRDTDIKHLEQCFPHFLAPGLPTIYHGPLDQNKGEKLCVMFIVNNI